MMTIFTKLMSDKVKMENQQKRVCLRVLQLEFTFQSYFDL